VHLQTQTHTHTHTCRRLHLTAGQLTHFAVLSTLFNVVLADVMWQHITFPAHCRRYSICTNRSHILNDPFKRDISPHLTYVELHNDCEYMHWIVLRLAVHSESSHKQNILHSFGYIEIQNDRQSRGERRRLKGRFSVQERERRSWQAEGQLHMSVFLDIFCR